MTTPGRDRPVALITGASSGIGAAFAREVASRGFDLVISARRTDRLEALAAEIGEATGAAVEVVPADLSTDAGVGALEAVIARLPRLDMLVSNAGLGLPGALLDVGANKQLALLHIHVIAAFRLTRAALVRMVARARGDIVHVSSLAGFLPVARNADYASTKAFQITLCEALAEEFRGRGIRIQALCPGYTRTEFHYTAAYDGVEPPAVPSWGWMMPEAVVRESLSALRRGRVVAVPGRINRLALALLRGPFTRRPFLSWLRAQARREPKPRPTGER